MSQYQVNIVSLLRNCLVFSIFSLFLIACGGGVTGDPDNFIAVNDQDLTELNKINIDNIETNQKVWIVIYESGLNNSMSDKIIGKQLVEGGQFQDVSIELDRDVLDSELLYAQLRSDGDNNEMLDVGVNSQDNVISQSSLSAVSFIVRHSTDPFLAISDQSLKHAFDDLIVEKVVAASPSWIVIHRFDDEKENNLGEIVGHEFVPQGHSSNLHIPTMGNRTGLSDEKVIVVLYRNVTPIADDLFDKDQDVPVELNGAQLSQIIDIQITP